MLQQCHKEAHDIFLKGTLQNKHFHTFHFSLKILGYQIEGNMMAGDCIQPNRLSHLEGGSSMFIRKVGTFIHHTV
jgi:hypothetical protein